MIQANELRIGNYVASDHFKERDIIVKVRLIGQEQAIVEHLSGLSEPMLYQGEMRAIKLTEEVLLKCGAVKVPHKIFTNCFELPLKRNKKIVISDIGTPNFMMGIVECNFETGQVEDVVNVHNWDIEKDMYLHQFQNIYFALTGKELEIKV